MTLEKCWEGLVDLLHSFCEREQLSEYLVFFFLEKLYRLIDMF